MRVAILTQDAFPRGDKAGTDAGDASDEVADGEDRDEELLRRCLQRVCAILLTSRCRSSLHVSKQSTRHVNEVVATKEESGQSAYRHALLACVRLGDAVAVRVPQTIRRGHGAKGQHDARHRAGRRQEEPRRG